MTFETLHRSAAGAFMVSGLLLGYSYISHPHHMTPATIASTSWIIIHSLFLVSLVAGMLGTAGFYLRYAQQSGWTALTGFLAAFTGLAMIIGLDYYEVFIAPFLAVEFPAVIERYGAGDAMGPVALAFPISGAMTVAGYIGLAVAHLRIGAYSKPAMIALLLSSVVFGIGLSPLGGLFVARIGAMVFGVSLVWSGTDYFRSIRPAQSGNPVAATLQ